MGANPHANGGLLTARPRAARTSGTTPWRSTAPGAYVQRGHPRARAATCATCSGSTRTAGTSALFGPDETASNRLADVFEVTDRAWGAEIEAGRRPPVSRRPRDGGAERAPLPGLARGLSAHRPARAVQLLRGVHPHRRLDVQPARQVAEDLPRRSRGAGRFASLNYLLTSHVWRQDHNGSSHQDPGFIDHVVNKKAEVIRVYLPPDANCLLSVADHCLRSRDYVNVIVAGKQPALDYLLDGGGRARIARAASASGTGPTAHDDGEEPDVVMACAGDVPTLETLAAVSLVRRAPARPARAGGERRGPDAPPAGHRAPARDVRRRVRRALHREPARDLRLPRLSVADPPPDLPPDQPRRASTCAATRRRAPRPRPSTWSC